MISTAPVSSSIGPSVAIVPPATCTDIVLQGCTPIAPQTVVTARESEVSGKPSFFTFVQEMLSFLVHFTTFVQRVVRGHYHHHSLC